MNGTWAALAILGSLPASGRASDGRAPPPETSTRALDEVDERLAHMMVRSRQIAPEAAGALRPGDPRWRDLVEAALAERRIAYVDGSIDGRLLQAGAGFPAGAADRRGPARGRRARRRGHRGLLRSLRAAVCWRRGVRARRRTRLAFRARLPAAKDHRPVRLPRRLQPASAHGPAPQGSRPRWRRPAGAASTATQSAFTVVPAARAPQ
jgi:hypothetical protein